MAAVSPSRSAASPPARARPPARWPWWGWLVLGGLFALGHGIALRLIDLRPNEGPAGFQNFGVKPFPGQSLESLRRRDRSQPGSLLVDFEAIEREKRSRQEQAEFQQRRTALEDSQRQEQERLQREAEQLRLDALDRVPAEPAAPEPQPEPPAAAPEPAPAAPADTLPSLPPLPEAPPAPNPAGRP